jgi:hypothetical protein
MPMTRVTPCSIFKMSYSAATARRIQTVVGNFVNEIRAAHDESFPNTFQELSIATDDSLTVHEDLVRPRSILTANTISECICHYIGVRSSDNATRLAGGAEWGVVAAGGLTSDQRTTTVAERPACVQGILVMEDFDDNLDS